jgi:hypothetical protein
MTRQGINSFLPGKIVQRNEKKQMKRQQKKWSIPSLKMKRCSAKSEVSVATKKAAKKAADFEKLENRIERKINGEQREPKTAGVMRRIT